MGRGAKRVVEAGKGREKERGRAQEGKREAREQEREEGASSPF